MQTAVVGNERMSRLCESFPSLRNKPGTRPWNQHEFARWAGGPARTSGSMHAAAFVLGVWNGQSVGRSEPLWYEEFGVIGFDAVWAMGVWDGAHQRAFIAWCEHPFWP